jgi:hypothetical protein
LISIGAKGVGMKRFMLSITEEMEKALEAERKKRMLGSIPETARVIIGEYLSAPKPTDNEILQQAVKEYREKQAKLGKRT